MSKKQKVQKLFLETLKEEEKDFFLKYLFKQVQRQNKKLVQIEEIEEKIKKGEVIHENQKEKCSKKQETIDKKLQYDEMAKVYQSALKEQEQENKEVTQKKEQDQGEIEVIETVKETIIERTIEVESPQVKENVIDAVLRLALIGRKCQGKQLSCQQTLDRLGVSVQELDGVSEFYQNVFTLQSLEEFYQQTQNVLGYYNNTLDQSIGSFSLLHIHKTVDQLFSNLDSFNHKQQHIPTQNTTSIINDNVTKNDNTTINVEETIIPVNDSLIHHVIKTTQVEEHEVTHDKVITTTTVVEEFDENIQDGEQLQIQQEQQQWENQPSMTEQQTDSTNTNTQTNQTSQSQDQEKNNSNNQRSSRGGQRQTQGNKEYQRKNGGERGGNRNHNNKYNKVRSNRSDNQQENQEEPQEPVDDEWHVVGKKPQQPSSGFNNNQRRDRQDRPHNQGRNTNRRDQNRSGNQNDASKPSNNQKRPENEQYVKKTTEQ